MKSFTVASIALVVGAAIGVGASQFFPMNHVAMSGGMSEKSADEPLYWVAPMDPNYQRDQPGKSPMGMDLVPVYADDLAGKKDKPGTVTIDPAVENNLGVKTESVMLEPLTPKIETVGYVAFDESRLWQTNVRVAGWVQDLFINAVGETVSKGEVLFTLYSPELVKAQEELLSAYKTGRKGMILGAKERLVSLGVDKQQINQIVRRGKASQTIEIKAPADGVIATLNIREGGYLSPAQAVISAGPLEEVWVDAEVFERQAHWISQGTAASMTLDAVPGGEWSGRVDYVYPILDPTTRTLRVRLKFPNPDGELKPNMFSNITLKPESDDQVLTVARSSVIHSGGMTRVVLSEGEGKYRSHRIRVGREAGDRVEVLEGLEQGVSVVTSAHFMLDSESSQTADLSRISSINEEPMQMSDSVWAKGSITNLMVGHRMATIEHQPVPEWDWPGMVMDFTFSDEVDLSGLANGQAIDFKMEKTDSGQFQVTEVSQSDNTTAPEVWGEGDITMLMADFGMITVNHQAVDEWQWQAGEMNFTASDDIPLDDYKEGQKVRFLVVKSGTDYVLKKIESAEE